MLDSAEAREALVAMPAAGLLHGEVSAVERDYRWVRPLRFCDDQLRALLQKIADGHEAWKKRRGIR